MLGKQRRQALGTHLAIKKTQMGTGGWSWSISIIPCPPRLIFGRDIHRKAGTELRRLDAKRVLVLFGGGSAIRSGLLDAGYSNLEDADLDWVSLSGVVSNPGLELVHKGIELCRREGVDAILAVGGGSVIDSAKAIGLGIRLETDVWELFTGEAKAAGMLPVGCILTIAGSGSEGSGALVLTKEEGRLKRTFQHPAARCSFAIMNPELTYTLPWYQTASGCVDAMMHTLERYFTPEQTMETTDRIAEGVLRSLMDNLLRVRENPRDYDARAEIMWASNVAHNGITGCGGGPGDWGAHMLEHELGALFGVAHGAGLAAVWPSWARYVCQTNPERFSRLAVNVLGVSPSGESTETVAYRGIEAMEAFFRTVGMPTRIGELDVELTEEQIHVMATKCTANGPVGTFRPLEWGDAAAIYHMAR